MQLFLLIFSLLYCSHGTYSQNPQYYDDSDNDYNVDTNEMYYEEYSNDNNTNTIVAKGKNITDVNEVYTTTVTTAEIVTVANEITKTIVSTAETTTDGNIKVYTPALTREIITAANESNKITVLTEETITDANENYNATVLTDEMIVEENDISTKDIKTPEVRFDVHYTAYGYLSVITLCGVTVLLIIAAILICPKIRLCRQSGSYVVSMDPAAGIELREEKQK